MKISLNIAGTDEQTNKMAENKAMERLLLSVKQGDWEARELLLQRYRPLMLSLVQKRTSETALQNKYMEAAKAGLLAAASKYTHSVQPDRFQIFALDYIEASMNRSERRGFFARLFGGK